VHLKEGGYNLVNFEECEVKKGRIRCLLEGYLSNVGFPDAVLGKIGKREFVRYCLDVLLLRDFVERFRLENTEAARFLIYSLLQSVGSKVSVNKLYGHFFSTKETLPVLPKPFFSSNTNNILDYEDGKEIKLNSAFVKVVA